MKTKLLSFLLFTFFYSNAQVIDLIGVGVHGNITDSNLIIPDLNSVDRVDAVAVYSGIKGITDPDASAAYIYSSILTPTTDFNVDIENKSIVTDPINGAYHTASFAKNEIDNNGINLHVEDLYINYFPSFFAFIYRNSPVSNYKSFSSLETVFFYWNGSNDAYEYNIPINEASSSRNIKVKIPISELNNDPRIVVIDITAGSITQHIEQNTYNNLGSSLFIGEYALMDVPGTVDNIKVSIYSPDFQAQEANGDSFYVSGVVVDVDKVIDDGCTLTQGYWKTHSNCKAHGPERDDTWDMILPSAEDSAFFLSEQTYCEVFDTKSGKGGKYYILAHQYIAAELNLFAGADPTAIAIAFAEATEFLNTYTPADVKGDSELEAEAVRLGGILADFNEGAIGPGHCDDNEETSEAVQPEKTSKVAIYPNPTSSQGKIEFVAKQSGKTTVELFNINGRKVGVLFNEKTKKGNLVSIDYSAEQLRKGLYFAIIKNGSHQYKEKISIIK